MNRVLKGVGEFFLLALITLVAPLAIYIDITILGNEVGEISVTEFTQEGLLLMSAIIMTVLAVRRPDLRGLFALVAGFFGTMLIREFDFLFDMIWHGFWFWPAITLAIATVLYVLIKCRDTVIEPMARFFDTRAWFFLMAGLIIILVFSRVFGSGNLLWKEIMGEHYSHFFKSALQEGIELLGYLFLATGSVMTLKQYRRVS